jgi:predicted negative regulator of RcsB-dependent stress response
MLNLKHSNFQEYHRVAGLTRKELKTDQVAKTVFDVFEWTSEHRKEVVRWGALAVVAVIAIIGFSYYRSYQAEARQIALAEALRIDDAGVGSEQVQPQNLHYNTPEEKEKARTQAFSALAAKYSGTQEGAIAEIYLASWAADKGNLAEAEKRFKDVVDSGPKVYAAQARLSLAQVYAGEGKPADAQKVLQPLIDKPTETVSKEEAALLLAQLLVKSNPAEARKLAGPLRTSNRAAVSRAANSVFGELQSGQ